MKHEELVKPLGKIGKAYTDWCRASLRACGHRSSFVVGNKEVTRLYNLYVKACKEEGIILKDLHSTS